MSVTKNSATLVDCLPTVLDVPQIKSNLSQEQPMSTKNELAIKVIVELQAKPGKRAELKSLLESVVANYGQSHPGLLASTRYEVLDNPNILVEIADWTSVDVRAAAMQEAMAAGAYAPLEELLAAPFRATVIRQLP
jgi:quinol monooxygenase YgiN